MRNEDGGTRDTTINTSRHNDNTNRKITAKLSSEKKQEIGAAWRARTRQGMVWVEGNRSLADGRLPSIA